MIIAGITAIHFVILLVADAQAGAFLKTDLGARSLLRLLTEILSFPLVTFAKPYMNSSWGFALALTNSLLWSVCSFYLGHHLLKLLRSTSNV